MDRGCGGAIAASLSKEEVAIVGAKSVMRFLPEVRLSIWLDQEMRMAGFNTPNRGRIHPVKERMQPVTGECFVQKCMGHTLSSIIADNVAWSGIANISFGYDIFQ